MHGSIWTSNFIKLIFKENATVSFIKKHSIDWLIDGSIDCLIDLLNHLLKMDLIDRLIDWLIDRLIVWLIDCLLKVKILGWHGQRAISTVSSKVVQHAGGDRLTFHTEDGIGAEWSTLEGLMAGGAGDVFLMISPPRDPLEGARDIFDFRFISGVDLSVHTVFLQQLVVFEPLHHRGRLPAGDDARQRGLPAVLLDDG